MVPPLFARETRRSIGRARVLLILGTTTFFFGGFLVSAVFGPKGSGFAAFLTAAQIAAFLWHIWRYRDGLIARLLVFSLVLGFVELWGDAYWVVRDVLIYPPGLRIHMSPAYMPFMYGPALVQFGFMGWIATRKWGLIRASLGLAVVGGTWMPLYESLAKFAEFWHYENVSMLFGTTPWFIILAEFLLALSLPLLLRRVERLSMPRVVVLGLIGGIWFNFTGPFSYWITG